MIPSRRTKKMSLGCDIRKGIRHLFGRSSDHELVSETTPKLPEVVGKGKAIALNQAPHESTTGPHHNLKITSEKVVYESSSTTDLERTESETEAAAPKGDKEQGELASSTVTSGVRISVPYPKVHENLKLITDEHVIEDNPEIPFCSMSSMKNLEDTDNFGDQFLYDKPTEDDQEKSKVVDESDSTIPDPSHQTVTSTPLVIAPVTDFSSPKPSSLVTPPPINTEATNCFAFRDSFIVSKKRSSDSSKKLKGIQTLTPAKQEAADIMKALKESKKMSKRQPGTGGSNEGTGNILGVPDESTVISRASSEGTGSKPGVPDEEKLIL
ncbi:hypothetical protein Tco_0007790 [Tanacetum coccineum]